MGIHYSLYGITAWPHAMLFSVMSDVTRKSMSSCYTENWGEAILPIDDSVDVKSSDFDPRSVCRNLIESDSGSDKYECSSD